MEYRLRDAFRGDPWEYDDPEQYDRLKEERDGCMHIVIWDLVEEVSDFVELLDTWGKIRSLLVDIHAPETLPGEHVLEAGIFYRGEHGAKVSSAK